MEAGKQCYFTYRWSLEGVGPETHVHSFPDPGSVSLLILGSGMGKTQDPGSRARINNPDHTSQSPETILCAKIPKLSAAETGSEMEKIRIRDKYP